MVLMPHWPKKLRVKKSDRKLDVVREVLEKLGSPHKKLPKTIHIAGTNGKGSSCYMIFKTISEAGYKTCLYTSPHIEEFNERIVINGHKIDDEKLFYYAEKVRLVVEELNIELNFFDSTTIMAFCAFADSGADFLVMETGIGGLMDTTNIVENPILTLITSISYDHMEYLGTDIKDIAFQKAGIIKQNVPCIIGRQDYDVMDVFFKKCEEMNAPMICYEYDFIVEKMKDHFKFFSRLGDVEIEKFGLEGDHQIINAAGALAAIKLIDRQFNISEQSIKSAFEKFSWPGRIQKININHIFPNNPLSHCWIDGAHNNQGAAVLSEWISTKDFKNKLVILGMTRNRDVESFVKNFVDDNTVIIGITVTSEADSYPSSTLCDIAQKDNIDILDGGTLIEALEIAALKYPNHEIIVTGSLYLVSELAKIVKKSL